MRMLAACSLGGAGHLNPLLPFLAAARQRGDEVLVIAPPAMRELIEGAGFPFHPGGEPAEEEIAPIRERLPIAEPNEAALLGNRELFGRLATVAMRPMMERICAEWRPDFVLRDPCEYASAVVAGELAIPMAQVAISLADIEAGSIRTAAPALEAHRAGLVDELWASPYVSRMPAALDPSPFPTTIRFRDAEPVRHGTLPNWWGGSTAPLVYVSFGTVLGYMTIAARVFRTALAAVDGLEARVLLTVGRRFDRADLGPVPTNVHVEAWVDQADALGEADLVVCHGGSGTVFGALAAAVPVVVVPVFADQFENGRRICASGAGIVVDATHGGAARHVIGPADAPRMRDAITTVLSTPSYRDRASQLAIELSAAPRVDTVLDGLLSRLPKP